MDAFARGWKSPPRSWPTASWVSFSGRYRLVGLRRRAEIEAGKHDFASLEKYMLAKGEAAANVSGRQELLENIVNRYVF